MRQSLLLIGKLGKSLQSPQMAETLGFCIPSAEEVHRTVQMLSLLMETLESRLFILYGGTHRVEAVAVDLDLQNPSRISPLQAHSTLQLLMQALLSISRQFHGIPPCRLEQTLQCRQGQARTMLHGQIGAAFTLIVTARQLRMGKQGTCSTG